MESTSTKTKVQRGKKIIKGAIAWISIPCKKRYSIIQVDDFCGALTALQKYYQYGGCVPELMVKLRSSMSRSVCKIHSITLVSWREWQSIDEKYKRDYLWLGHVAGKNLVAVGIEHYYTMPTEVCEAAKAMQFYIRKEKLRDNIREMGGGVILSNELELVAPF